MSSKSYNLSKTYLLPLVSELIDINPKFINNLDNTYLFDENNEYNECFFILQSFSFKNPEYTAYEHKLTSSSLFLKHIDLGSKVLYIFKFPEEYLPEYYAFQRGEYSKFGNDAKELINKFWKSIYGKQLGAKPALDKVSQVLYKDPVLKEIIEERLSSEKHKVSLGDSELGEMMNSSSETYRKIIYSDAW
jgi:hypothetical protein